MRSCEIALLYDQNLCWVFLAFDVPVIDSDYFVFRVGISKIGVAFKR